MFAAGCHILQGSHNILRALPLKWQLGSQGATVGEILSFQKVHLVTTSAVF